ncbi:MAG: HU family DNA-binding protein [Chromatiales bacterium]|nr:HU family DNA-binding protein [Chromatiales bacterium]
MNKSELVDQIVSNTSLTKADASKALDATISAITNSLKQGQSVTIVGFGTFMVRESKARMGRNPRTGESIQISASKRPSFKAGKGLKDSLN